MNGAQVSGGAPMDERLEAHLMEEPAGALDEPERLSRARFVQKALVAGGAAAATGILVGGIPKLAASAPSRSQDVKILDYLLLLEHFQAAFYEEAVSRDRLQGELPIFARVVAGHEREHVAFIEKTVKKLGGRARKRPTLEFGDATSDSSKFRASAILLEEITAAAYIGQAGNLTKGTVMQIGRLVSTEARHTAWIRDIAGRLPAPRAADPGKSEAEVMKAIESTNFLQSA